MKTLKALFLGFCALAIVSCSDDDTGTNPDPTPTDNSFQSKTGDHSEYDTYRLDDNNEEEVTTASYSSRTVLRTNMTFQGHSNVTMAVDSTFEQGTTEVERVDTVYYRLDGNSLYIYNFAQTFVSMIPPDFALPLEAVAGWVKVAELQESSSQFTSELKVKIAGSSTELTVTIAASNKGKQTVEGTSYTAFHQELTATGTAPPPLSLSVSLPIILDVGGVKGASNSPSTLIRMQINKFANPMGGTINGRIQTLASFTAGS